MKLQIIRDGQGKNTGVFIPIEEWDLIKKQYPDIEEAGAELEPWEKELIDKRLNTISENPKRLKQGRRLLEELKQKI